MPPEPAAERPLQRGLRAALVLVPLGLTFALYQGTISLPYFWDDAVHLDYVQDRTIAQIWVDARGLFYYRPLIFTLYKVLFATLPPGTTVLPHVLILIVHSANAALLGMLTGRLVAGRATASPGRGPVAPIAAALYAVYPFAALPLPQVASAMHPLVVFGMLAGSLAALQYAGDGKRRWAALSLALSVLSPYLHETGIMTGGISALAVLLYDRGFAMKHKRWLVTLPLLSILFLPVWAIVPKTRTPGLPVLAGGEPEAMLSSVMFFLQAPTYPFQPLATGLMRQIGWSPHVAVWLAGACALAVAGYLLLRARLWRPLVFGLSWAALTSLPSVMGLSYSYIVLSPRLLYTPGAGGVLLWAAAFAAAGQVLSRRVLRWVFGLTLGILAFGVPLAYVQREMRLYAVALSPLHQVTKILPEYPRERHLVVNLIEEMHYLHPWYPLGFDGVPALVSWVDLRRSLYANSLIDFDVTAATFTDLLPGWPEPLRTAGEDRMWTMRTLAAEIPHYDRVWLTIYRGYTTRVVEAGHLRPAAAGPPSGYLADFEGKVYLVNAEVSVEGHTAVVTLDWYYQGPDPEAVVFRNVFDCAANVTGLGSGPTLEGMVAFGDLVPGMRVHDVRHVHLDSLSPDGCYQVELGLFRSDGSRVNARAPDGSVFANDVVPLRR